MIDAFRVYLEEEVRRSPNTVYAYMSDLGQFSEFNQKDLRAVTRADAKAYLRHLSGRGLSASSIVRKIAACNALYSWLVREDVIEFNPFHDLDLPSRPGRLPKNLSKDEMESLLAFPSNSMTDIRDRAIIDVLYSTGMRVGELESVDVTAVDMETRRITVIGKGNKERLVPFGDGCYESLMAWFAVRNRMVHEGEPALFVSAKGYRLQRSGIEWIVARLGERILDKNVTPHWFRHTCGTHMRNNGAEYGTIADILGHADSNITRKLYAHTSMERTEDEYRETHPRARRAVSARRLRVVR